MSCAADRRLRRACPEGGRTADTMPRPAKTNTVGAAEGSWLVTHAGCGLQPGSGTLLLLRCSYYCYRGGYSSSTTKVKVVPTLLHRGKLAATSLNDVVHIFLLRAGLRTNPSLLVPSPHRHASLSHSPLTSGICTFRCRYAIKVLCGSLHAPESAYVWD